MSDLVPPCSHMPEDTFSHGLAHIYFLDSPFNGLNMYKNSIKNAASQVKLEQPCPTVNMPNWTIRISVTALE